MSFVYGMVVGGFIGVYLANKEARNGVNSTIKRFIKWCQKKSAEHQASQENKSNRIRLK